MNVTEEQLSAINQGRMAVHTLNFLKPVFDEIENGILSRMKSMVRSGEHSEAKLLAAAAELCTLEDIQCNLKAKVNRADTQQKEIDNARD